MHNPNPRLAHRPIQLVFSLLGGLLAVAALLFFMGQQTRFSVQAAPVPPPEGFPKLSLSTKMVTPTLAGMGGETLEYVIEIVNTGAYMAEDVTLVDEIPSHTTFTGKAGASVSPSPSFANGILTWKGTVGFDTTVVITFSVVVDSDYAGILSNTAVISQPLIAKSVTVTAETTITNDPILSVTKSSSPTKPGANKPLIYELTVTNHGQPVADLPITVVDTLPENTSLLNVGDGSASGNTVTWTRAVSLAFQETSVFTFSVSIANVPSGTVINNADYYVKSAQTGVSAGEPYTVTVIDPILYISKDIRPYPPGANREMNYILTVLNKGSLATDLTISDVVPDNVTYLNGGLYEDGTVSWKIPGLDTGESAWFTYTVYIGDIAEVDVLNKTYEVCSAEDVCVVGEELTSVIQGPTFVASAELDPIAKKPGGGGGPVTPTLKVQNLGPGNALDAVATLYFKRISVSLNDLLVDPPAGSFEHGPDCGEKCSAYIWIGDISYGETITFTTIEGQSTIGGDEGTNYTATVVISDSLGIFKTEPITATAIGRVTHYANLIPMKSGSAVVGAGQMMTYTIQVYNSGLSTEDPPFPTLVETLPVNVTFVRASDGAIEQTIADHTVISWTLPAMGPGDRIFRSFTVLVNEDLFSGTEIINSDYHALWFESEITTTQYLSNTGRPFTTVVKEVGLIDSFKSVMPELTRPDSGIVLTYVVHVINSSLIDLQDVQMHDLLPWENSTYQRDAVASSGEIISDIVSIDWVSDIAALSSERITFTVIVDPDFEGAITNTAWIQHPSLREDIPVSAVAYITDDPVLQITKSAFPDPVQLGDELLYTIKVLNLGQQATNLDILDTLPGNTAFVAGSASAGGKLVGNMVHWELPVLLPGGKSVLAFRVKVMEGDQVINNDYWVTCNEGVKDIGEPVITMITRRGALVYLPIIHR